MNLSSDEKAALYAAAVAAGYRHLSAYLVDRGLGRKKGCKPRVNPSS